MTMLAANIKPGIINVPGRDPETQALAESLLEQDREKHHCFFNAQGFHNHLSHHLLAAYDLGAPAAVLQAIYDKDCQIQKPIDSLTPPEPVQLTPENFTQYLGDARYYHAFLSFFTARIQESGASETIETYIFSPAVNTNDVQMLARFMSGLYHPLIQTGYGIEFGSDAMVAQGLAQAAMHSPLVSPVLNLTVGDISSLGDEKRKGEPLFHILHSLYKTEALKPVPYNPDKLINQLTRDTMADGRPEEIKRLCSIWWGNDQIESRASEIDAKVEELFWATALLLCGTSKRGRKPRLDFVIMHAMNATLFLPSLLKAIPNSGSRAKLLCAFLSVTLLYVLVRGRPRIDVGLAMSYPAAPRPHGWKPPVFKPSPNTVGDPNETYNPWLNICGSAVFASDAHAVKAIRVLCYAAQHYGHKKARNLSGCFVDEENQKEALPGISQLDGTLFVRTAGVVLDTLGWVAHGDDPGKWDFSGIGWEDAWEHGE